MPLADWLAAAAYEEVSERMRAAQGSLADMQDLEDRPQPSQLNLPRRIAMATTPNIRSAVGRARAAAAKRQLVLAAIGVRRRGLDTGRYPDERDTVPGLGEPDALSGQLLGYEVGPSGAAELWVRDIQDLLRVIEVPSGSVDATVPIRLPAP